MDITMQGFLFGCLDQVADQKLLLQPAIAARNGNDNLTSLIPGALAVLYERFHCLIPVEFFRESIRGYGSGGSGNLFGCGRRPGCPGRGGRHAEETNMITTAISMSAFHLCFI